MEEHPSAHSAGCWLQILGPPGCPSSKIPAYTLESSVDAAASPHDDPPLTAGDCVRDAADSVRLCQSPMLPFHLHTAATP